MYTRNPEDIKEVTPYAIEATKAQSLRDVGIEMLPFEEHEGRRSARSVACLLPPRHPRHGARVGEVERDG